ncbi:MAG: FAD-dependent oxidoreductase [Hyphomicrobiaceae bacterium]
MHKPLKITIAGAGIFGIWQAMTLARAGHAVRVLERCPVPFEQAASQYAGAMIAPYCEAETAEPVVRDLGLEAARLWKEVYPGLVHNGTLVVAGPRDQTELRRYSRMTVGHSSVGAERIGELEPDLAGRFSNGLFFADEAHMATPEALHDLLNLARSAGAQFQFGSEWRGEADDTADCFIDCRGIAARDDLDTLRGVRGERLLIETDEIFFSRPIRLLHPRFASYIVPWGDGRFLVGATLIESDDDRAITVRSALELLGLAYALHPAFGEAQIIEMTAGVRPSFADNVPRVLPGRGAQARIIRVNGAFRHGFLLAPVMADVVAKHLGSDNFTHPLLVRETT